PCVRPAPPALLDPRAGTGGTTPHTTGRSNPLSIKAMDRTWRSAFFPYTMGEPHGLIAVAPPPDFGVTRRSVPSFAKATEGYPPRIYPRVNTRGSLRRRVEDA